MINDPQIFNIYYLFNSIFSSYYPRKFYNLFYYILQLLNDKIKSKLIVRLIRNSKLFFAFYYFSLRKKNDYYKS